jgi:hypothetical protein
MANVVGNWSALERSLLQLYALVTGAFLAPPDPEEVARGPWPPTPHRIAFLTFDALVTMGTKLDVIENVLREVAQPEELAQFRDHLNPEIRRRAGERNVVVHGFWCRGIEHRAPNHSSEIMDAVVLRPVIGSMMLYKLADFQDISGRINQLDDKIRAYMGPIEERERDRAKTYFRPL